MFSICQHPLRIFYLRLVEVLPMIASLISAMLMLSYTYQSAYMHFIIISLDSTFLMDLDLFIISFLLNIFSFSASMSAMLRFLSIIFSASHLHYLAFLISKNFTFWFNYFIFLIRYRLVQSNLHSN